ncbi:MAG TPA: hypothetical protein VF469_20065 [Kofleriaceae bacterium]
MQPASAMAIEIDDAKFQQILDVTLGSQRLGPHEIRTVLLVAQLAAAVDLDDDPAERTTLQALTSRLCAWGGISPDSVPLLSPVPMDEEERAARIATLVRALRTTGARDLAFALAYLIIVADLELAPIEDSVLQQLQRELTIPGERASDLISAVAAIVTPGEAPDTTVVARTC